MDRNRATDWGSTLERPASVPLKVLVSYSPPIPLPQFLFLTTLLPWSTVHPDRQGFAAPRVALPNLLHPRGEFECVSQLGQYSSISQMSRVFSWKFSSAAVFLNPWLPVNGSRRRGVGHPSALNVLSLVFVGQWLSSNSDLGPTGACVCLLLPLLPGSLGFPQPGHLPVPEHLICVPGHYLDFHLLLFLVTNDVMPCRYEPGGLLSLRDWSTLGSTGAAKAP